MSSLLDVLHKRPARNRLVSEPDGPEAPAPETAPDPTVELRLAGDPDPLLRTLTTRHPGLPSAEGPAGEGETLRVAEPMQSAHVTERRRWSDSPTAPATTPRAKASRPGSRYRIPVLLALLVAVAGVLGYGAFRVSGTPEESFLAAPGQVPPPPAQPAREASPVAPAQQATSGAKAKRAAREVDADATAGDVAWYDQPALPPEAGDVQAAAPRIEITHGASHDPLFDRLRAAYAALQAGDAARAEPLYREVLAANPGSEDALLGLASLAARGGRWQEARELYREVQRLDPRNGTAAAALSALPGASATPATESALKDLLREQPDSAPLQFALGLRYVADQRWADAQAAFFEAVRHDPTNADYAFNLAVSLDRIGQDQAAASYYERAAELATGSQQFAVETARERLATLRMPRG